MEIGVEEFVPFKFLWGLRYANVSLTHSLTHSLRCRHWNGWNGNRAVRARRHIEIETAHHQIGTKTKNFCGYSVQQIPGVAKHLFVQVMQLVTYKSN